MVMVRIKNGEISIGKATIADIPQIASLFTESFIESVLHHCGGVLPEPQAMQDVFTLVYQAEPEAAIVARDVTGKVIGYCFAPTELSNLWLRAIWEGHLLKWAWRWISGKYGFGLHPVKIIIMNKVAFFYSAVTPSKPAKGRILSIAVAEEARGQGVANLLLENAIKYFSKKRINRVRLEVRPSNKVAIRLYEKWNFVFAGYTADSQGKWMIMYKEMEHDHV